MEIVYFTAAAIALYLISDWVVNLIERKRGERLQNRTVLFFVIIFTLSVVAFNAIQYFTKGDENENSSKPTPTTSETTKAQ